MKKKLIVAMLALTLLLSLAACNKTKATGLEITAQPSKNFYILGEELDLNGGKFKVKYSDNTLSEEILMTAQGVSHNFNKNVTGSQTVTITYLKVSGTITVTVMDEVTAFKTYLAAFPTVNFDVYGAVWAAGQTKAVTDALALLNSMSEAKKSELETADVQKVIKAAAYMYRTQFYDMKDEVEAAKNLIADYDDLTEFLEYFDEFTDDAESILGLIDGLDDSVVLYTAAGQDITSTALADLLRDVAAAVGSGQKAVAMLLDGVYGIKKSEITVAGTKIKTSFEFFKELYDKGGSVFTYTKTAVKAYFPAYFDILCEYFYLLDNEVTEDVEFIFNNFIDPQIVSKANNVAAIADTLWELDADGDGELFILNYARYLALLNDITAYGYDYIWGFASAKDEALKPVYEGYSFDGLDEPVFYELYIKYLELKEADTGEGFYATVAFKTLAESMLEVYYGAGFNRQWSLKKNALRFKNYFDAYIEKFVENYTNELSFNDLALAREALENARVSPTDKYGDDSLLSFYNTLTNAENWYLFVKYNINDTIHPYMGLEYESLIADYMYKIGQILDVYKAWDNNFYIWENYMGRSGFPSDMVYCYAYAMGLERIFNEQYSNDAAIMAKYDDYVAVPMQTMSEITDEYYQVIADRYDADMYETSILYWERILKVFNKRTRDSAAYFEFWQKLGPEMTPFIEEWWQTMFIEDEEYIALGIGFYRAIPSAFNSVLSEYLEYYVFADYFDFSKYGDSCPLMKLYYDYFSNPIGTLTWGYSPSDEYILTQLYAAMKDFAKLSEEEQQLYNFLPNGGFNGYIQALFDEYKLYEDYVYETGWQLSKLNVAYLSTRTSGNKYVFVSSFIELMDIYNRFTDEQKELINQVYVDYDGKSTIESWYEIYKRYMYPYAVADDGLGISQQDVEDFLSTFKVMAGLMEDYGAEIKEVLDAEARGEEVDPDTWDRVKDAANEFFDILNSVPNRMKEALVAAALDNDTLFGEISYHFMGFMARDFNGEGAIELAKTLINVHSNYLAYTAELERIEAIGGDSLTNYYLYRFLEVFTLNNITDKFNKLTIEEKEEFVNNELFFDLYSDLLDKFNDLYARPSALFERLVEEYRTFNEAWSHYYGSFLPWDAEFQAKNVGDLAFYYAAYEIFEEFMTYFHDNATELDEMMFENVVIMINIGMSPNSFYETYYKRTGLFIYAANAADMYQDLFLDILYREVAAHAEQVLTGSCLQLINSLTGIAKSIITEGSQQSLYDLNEQVILDFMAKFRTLDDETAFWFAAYFPSYYSFILDYYAYTLPVRDIRIMESVFETEKAILIYKYWYKAWQDYLRDPEMEEWQAEQLYNSKVTPAESQLWYWATRAYNLYERLPEAPYGLITSLFDMTVLPEFACIEQGCPFNETLHNVGSLLMAANAMYFNRRHLDFNIMYNLAVIAIDGLSADDLEVFNTAVYYQYEDEDENIIGLTLKDMYEEIQRLNLVRIEEVPVWWLSDEEREEALRFYGIYQAVAWEWWLGDFSDWSHQQFIDGARDVLNAFCNYLEFCADDYTIRNDIQKYCIDGLLTEMLYNIAIDDFGKDSVAFDLAYQMLYAYDELLDGNESSFVYKMNDCLAMYQLASVSDIFEFRAVFGKLFDQLAIYWEMVYRYYI